MNKGFHRIGWTVTAALAAVLVASGFQATAPKLAVVSMSKLVTMSDFGKASQATIDKLSSARKEMLTFVAENSVMTVDQAQKYHELSLKATQSETEKLALAQVRTDATTNTKKLQDLVAKTAPTAEEKQLMTDFNNRSLATKSMVQGWAQDFQQEVQTFGESQYALTMDHVQSSLLDTAKAQGCTIVFDARYAPYGATDLTDSVMTAMNAKK